MEKGRYITPRKPRNPLNFFEDNYIPEPNSGCHLWTGRTFPNGYGMIMARYSAMLAHRFSLQIHTADEGNGKYACHHCDVPMCVNPEHLFWGTQTDNMSDAAKKGRTHSKRRSFITHCPSGHEYTTENTRYEVQKNPSSVARKCKECCRIRAKAKYHNKLKAT